MRIIISAWLLWSIATLTSCDFNSAEPEATATKSGHSTVSDEFARELQMEAPVVSTAAVDLDSPGPIFEKGSPDLKRLRGVYRHGGSPFVGVIEERYPSGEIRSQARYQAGKQHGNSYKWYESGTLREERSFKEGQKHGRHRGWWKDGSPRFLYAFVDGKYDGECLDWHESGQISRARYYELGAEVGHQRCWNPDGKLLSNYVVKDGRRHGRLGEKP